LETFSSVAVVANGWYLTAQIIGGLGHLEGATVGILTDGGVHADKEVIDGYVTLDYPARYVIMGLRYVGIGRTLDLELVSATVISQGRLRSVEKLFLKLRNTLGGKFGTTLKGLYAITEPMYRRAGRSYYDRPPTLFSGLKDVSIRDTWANEKKIYFVQDQPLPMTLLSIIPAQDIGEVE
jgi:hypothetical protein